MKNAAHLRNEILVTPLCLEEVVHATLCRRLRWLQQETNTSDRELAQAIGLSLPKWRRKLADGGFLLVELCQIAALFNLSPDQLIAEPDIPPALALPSPPGHAPVPVFTTRHLRVISHDDTPWLYLPQRELDAADLCKPFAIQVDSTLVDHEHGLELGDYVLCEKDWQEYLLKSDRSKFTFLFSAQGQAALLTVRREIADALTKIGRIIGVVVGRLSIHTPHCEVLSF